jgi:glycerophosphoryl diester phosphodiesterase
LSAPELIASSRRLVIGHRGYSDVAPENTLASFRQALVARADLVELDYRQSQDGTPVVIHDATLDRTTDARARWRRSRIRVADCSAAEMRTLDAGGWFDSRFRGARVPLLAEALDLIVGAGGMALVEHKSGDAARCAELLRRRNLINKVVVISFDWAYLRHFQNIEPAQVLGALGPTRLWPDGRRRWRITRKLSGRWLDELRPTGARVVVWNRGVTAESIALAHQRGLKVWVYTVDELKLARRLLDLGVDGIITNRIVPMRGVLNRHTPSRLPC